MFSLASKCLDKPVKLYNVVILNRYLSATEISTALRPFYFSVHPDLFGKYPTQRAVNENSLQQLSLFIETVRRHKPFQPCNLPFYLRNSNNTENFRLVEIPLREQNLRSVIIKILKTCNLSTEYIDAIVSEPEPPKPPPKPSENSSFEDDASDINDIVFIRRKINLAKRALTLKCWIKDNYENALKKEEDNFMIRKDIKNICDDIYKRFKVKNIKWDCGWNVTHFKGCLQSFNALAKDHPENMDILKNRTLVFAQFTGVSLDGHVMLNSGEVRHNWLDLIKNVNKYDAALARIPNFEKALSKVLRDINVVRRKFMPKILAEEYEKHLSRLMTNVSDYCGYRGYPNSWPDSLNKYQIVVETEAGPLTVSPTGQFIVPSSCPGFLLINFITDNLNHAAQKTADYNAHKHIEKSLRVLCIKELKLKTLQKDDHVIPENMIKCCELLLHHKADLNLLEDINLNITTYYSVLTDGVVCIPWNFKI